MVVNAIGGAFLMLSYVLRSSRRDGYELEFDTLAVVGVITFCICSWWSGRLIIRSAEAKENSKWVPVVFCLVFAEFVLMSGLI